MEIHVNMVLLYVLYVVHSNKLYIFTIKAGLKPAFVYILRRGTALVSTRISMLCLICQACLTNCGRTASTICSNIQPHNLVVVEVVLGVTDDLVVFVAFAGNEDNIVLAGKGASRLDGGLAVDDNQSA